MNARISARYGLHENVGDARGRRDPTADAALKARLADPAATAAADAAQQAANAAALAAQDPRPATEQRIAALTAQFGDWAVVADVLQQEDGLDGERLASALEVEKKFYPTASAWMRANF